jgi:hypothetical protein
MIGSSNHSNLNPSVVSSARRAAPAAFGQRRRFGALHRGQHHAAFFDDALETASYGQLIPKSECIPPNLCSVSGNGSFYHRAVLCKSRTALLIYLNKQ